MSPELKLMNIMYGQAGLALQLNKFLCAFEDLAIMVWL